MLDDYDPNDRDPPPIETMEDLEKALQLEIDCSMAAWLVEAVAEAVCNDDLLFLKRAVRKHITGWTR